VTRAIVRRAGRLVLAVVGVPLLLLALFVLALLLPQGGPLTATGDYAVVTAQYTFVDASRIEEYAGSGAHRVVNVTFWYPEPATGRFPLIVFSHGAFGTRNSNLSLYAELASHGYVVAAVDHPYHAPWTRDVEGRLTLLSLDYAGELQRENARADRQQSLAYYRGWMGTRMGDLNLVIESVLARAAGGAAGVYGAIDGERLGVMGHSLGGSAALGIGRQRRDIGAVIALEAPFMYDIVDVEDGEFVFAESPYPSPVLNIYSDSAWDHLAEWPQYARNHALLTDTRPQVANVHIGGVGHLGLTDLALSNPWLVRLLDGIRPTVDHAQALRQINQVCLTFLDRHLKGALD
jgi:dienelactone hydrolase